MKKLQRVQGRVHTGKLDYINITACLMLIIYNIIDLTIKNMSLAEYIIYIVPYAIYPIINYFYRTKKVTAILYLLIGSLTIMLDPNILGYSGIIFTLLSYNEIRTTKHFYVIIIASLISLTLRFYIIPSEGIEAVVIILLFAFIFTTVYFKIIKDNTRLSNLPKEIKSILDLYCDGNNYEQISTTLKLGITPGTVRRKITAFMNKNDIKNDAQLGKWLHRNV